MGIEYLFMIVVLLSPLYAQGKGQSLVCYFPGYMENIPASQVDPFLCTHIIYAFAYMNRGVITPLSVKEEKQCRELIGLKQRNSHLKVSLSVQGSLSGVVKTKTARQRFARDVVKLLLHFGFDGLDINWEYPSPTEKVDYISLLQAIRRTSDDENYDIVLTSAVPAYRHVIDSSYNVPELAKALDAIHVMTYDLHKVDPRNLGVTAFNSPFHSPRHDPSFDSVESAIMHWESKGMPKSKIVVGIPTYGITYTLVNVSNNGFHAAVAGPGKPGGVLRASGYYSYTESCWLMSSGATRVLDEVSQSSYMYLGDQWVSYDDVDSVMKKSKWIEENRYGGAMVWNLQMDDVTGACGGTTFPLLQTIKKTLGRTIG